jgi:hypothetical protein
MLHYLPIVIFFFVIKCSLICALGGPRKSWAFVKDLLTIGDDYWTWTTRSGEWFEDVEIEQIEADELVLRHKFGVARLAIDLLSEKSRYVLFHTQKWADYIAACGEIETLPVRQNGRTRQAVAA